tara:strand:+ start:580 stop:801 length:222 start_codon:yes stop_codon:yes gene_type:complete
VSQKDKIALAEEAKTYSRKKRTIKSIKPLTSRRYLAGQALSGILSSSKGQIQMNEVRRSAYEWADFMLETDED